MTRLPLLAAALIALAAPVFAQAPAGALPAGGQRPPQSPPSNLQVLPKDMTRMQVVAIMHAWEGELGVECEYCHAKDTSTGRLNFASDANPVKDRARVMMKMTKAIDSEYLTQLVNPAAGSSVNCGTCHRGMAKPPVFEAPAHEPRPGTAPVPPALPVH